MTYGELAIFDLIFHILYYQNKIKTNLKSHNKIKPVSFGVILKFHVAR